MLKKLIFLFIVLSFIGFNSYSIKTNEIEKPINSTVQEDSNITFKKDYPIALVGDLQRTTVWELMIGREQNEMERKKIIENIALHNPAALILLGDMVSNGSDIKEWDYLHNLLKPIMSKDIPVIPVLGNHEYWGDNSIALNNAKTKFSYFPKIPLVQ